MATRLFNKAKKNKAAEFYPHLPDLEAERHPWLKALAWAVLLAVVMMNVVLICNCSGAEPKPPYLPLNALDIDGNNDGVISMSDVLLAARSAVGLDGYNRKYDLTFKGSVTMSDALGMAQYVVTGDRNLEQLRRDVLTNEKVTLTWPDGWTAPLQVLTPDMTKIQKFTGTNSAYGWLHGALHPAVSAGSDPTLDYSKTTYVCIQFSWDMAVASYKTLGYGAIQLARLGSVGHACNAFFIGGDWHNFNNWRVLEPQVGWAGTSPLYDISFIIFPTKCLPSYPWYEIHCLAVNFADKTVDYSSIVDPVFIGVCDPYNHEEHLPDNYVFATTLGDP